MFIKINSDNKKIFGYMAVISVIIISVSLLLNIMFISYSNNIIKDTYASIIGTVSSKYPKAEESVVHDIEKGDNHYLKLGCNILEKYGMKNLTFSSNVISSSLFSFVFPSSLLFIIAVCLTFLILQLIRQKNISLKVNELTDYLVNIRLGNYSLDIRDNSEGSLSILKNEIYKMTVMLTEQAEELKKDKKFLADSIADISHQIKTPLTSLFVIADILTQEPPEEDRYRFIKELKQQLDRIQWLVSSLLKLSKLDAGMADLKNEKVNIKSLIDKAVEPMRIPIDIKGQNLLIDADDKAGFYGDFNWSAEALTNIIKNCVEHTGEGGTIKIRCRENALFSSITVQDNGEGIEEQDLPHIFKRFYKGKNSAANSFGIGLAMAKSIFQSQKGDITVESKKSEGTIFSIKIYKCVI